MRVGSVASVTDRVEVTRVRPLLPGDVKPMLLPVEACVIPPPTVAGLVATQRSRTTFGMAPSVRTGEIFTTSPEAGASIIVPSPRINATCWLALGP